MNPDVVLRQLQLSLCSTGAAQEEAMRGLQSFESQPLFVSSLVAILQAGADMNAKMLAMICLKNVVHRQWVQRGSSRYVVSQEEKLLLREYLLGPSLGETNSQLSVHLGVLLSKVARHDWPGDWPGVLEHLYNALQSSPEWIVRKNCMLYLMRALKELASKAMPVAKRAFCDIAVRMLPAIAGKWRELSSQLRVSFENPNTFQQTETAIELEELCSHLTACVNILSRLVTRCFSVVVKEAYIPSFFELLVSDMDYFASALRSNASGTCQVASNLSCEAELEDNSDAEGGADSDGGDTDDEGGPGVDYSAAPLGRRSQIAVLKFICRLRHLLRKTATIPTKLQKKFPAEMAPFLGPFMAFYLQQLIIGYGSVDTLDLTGTAVMKIEGMNPAIFSELHGLSIQAVLFLSNVLSCREYSVDNRLTSPRAVDPIACPTNTTADAAINSFLLSSAQGTLGAGLSPSCADKILLLLIRSLLIWTSRDIKEWVNDPEDLLLSEEGERENDSVRTAAQGLFYGLMDRSPGPTKAALRSIMLQLSQNPCLPIGEGLSSSVVWEAVFLAAGLSGDKLFPHTFQDFSESNDGDSNMSPVVRSGISLNPPDEWIDTTLLPLIYRLIQQHDEVMASGAAPPPQLILRRLFWLLTCWLYLVPAENSELLTRVLSTLVYAIEPRNFSAISAVNSGSVTVFVDLPTALQASSAIQSLVNADVLDINIIVSNFSKITNSLCSLTTRFEEPELCAKIVSVISDIVSSLCGRNTTVASIGALQIRESGLILPLSARLYSLWQNSDENSPLRSNLLDVFAKLARSAGCSAKHESKFGNLTSPQPFDVNSMAMMRECACCSDSETYCSLFHDLLLRIVMFSASGSMKVAHLTNSAVSIWLLIVRRTRRYTAALDAVFVNCLPRLFSTNGDTSLNSDDEESPVDIMDMMSSDIQTIFHVIEAYVIAYTFYCPSDASVVPFVVRYESILTQVYRRVLGELRPQVVSYIIRPLEILLMVSPEETLLFLGRSEVLSFLVRACMGSPLSATPSTGAALMQSYSNYSETADIVIVSYLHVIARVILLNQALGLQVISSISEAAGHPPVAGVELIVLHMLEKFDSVGFDNMTAGAWRKRLWAFSLLSLLPLSQYTRLIPVVAPDIMALVDSLGYVDPYSKVSPHDPAWNELVEGLAKSILRVVNDDDDDDDDFVSDDGAEYDFDSAIGGKGSQVPGNPGGQKAAPEKEATVDIFEKVLCRDHVLTTQFEHYSHEKVGHVRNLIGVDAANKLFSF